MFSKSLIGLSVLVALFGCTNEQTESENNTTGVAAQSTQVAQTAKVDTDKRASIDARVAQFTQDFIKSQPALATSLNLSSDIAGNFQRQLPDYSPTGMKALQQKMQLAASQLASIETQNLSDNDKRHVVVNQVIANYYAGDAQFNAGYIDTWGGHLPYIVNQISGPLIDIPTILTDQQAISDLGDAADYLHRLTALAEMTNQVKVKVEADAANGVILPKPLFANTLKFLAKFTAKPASEHSLVTSFQEKLNATDKVDAKHREAFIAQASKLVDEQIYPAYRDVSALMTSLARKAPTDVGIWAQPNGESFYQHGITYLADSDLSADEIHQLGIEEVNRITSEMDSILKANGYNRGSVGERMIQLSSEPRFLYENSDAGRQQLLKDLSKDIETVMTKAPQLFSTLPPQEVIVKRVPVETEAGAAGGSYIPPALDASRPGVFFINLKDMTSISKYGLKTLTYHEAVPGHHFQIALNMLQKDIGLMRQNASFNAYIEGWALYSELLASEMGMYENDPWGNLGRLKAEAYRAARLVVDTGLHHKKWTRQQAIEYFSEATGSTQKEVTSAIDRYIAWPGQALGYKLGMLKLVELRALAQQTLGDKFDIRAFHDLILLPGARPMSVVQSDVEQWIEAQI
ncbi:DUF885 domain-containing protein [Shewanella benthica]|uniref:DUF885 domain-containing protein n=1 Tax=Shewanella benthica TaxID=43661 RepID=UPI001879A90B|nr:DUF885 domain-containing protein [Shewanella benthica]MBE7214118.1 DUF885 domain-containing protein [Shewanella benthica]MCL1061359.1 DUF885 domain-containing protein [Shewanella benthica]